MFKCLTLLILPGSPKPAAPAQFLKTNLLSLSSVYLPTDLPGTYQHHHHLPSLRAPPAGAPTEEPAPAMAPRWEGKEAGGGAGCLPGAGLRSLEPGEPMLLSLWAATPRAWSRGPCIHRAGVPPLCALPLSDYGFSILRTYQ